MLTQEAIKLIKNELRNDPENVGYQKIIRQYKEDPNQIHLLLKLLNTSDYEITTKVPLTISDFIKFIINPPKDAYKFLKNRNIITTLIKRIPDYSSVGTALAELNAQDLLDFLNYYGSSAMLNYFGVPNFDIDEANAFEVAARGVLEYIISKDGIIDDKFVYTKRQSPPRITIVLEGLSGNSNFVSEDELVNILSEL